MICTSRSVAPASAMIPPTIFCTEAAATPVVEAAIQVPRPPLALFLLPLALI